MIKLKDILSEIPLDTFQTIGNFDKGASFSDKRDRALITNPVTVQKVTDFFKNTTADFDFYFVNLPGRKGFAEKGEVKPDFVFAPYRPGYGTDRGLGIKPEQLRDGKLNRDHITVFFVGNTAAEKIPMTAWTMAHRLGHAINRDYGFKTLTDWLNDQFNQVLGLYKQHDGISSYNPDYYEQRDGFSKAKANLFNQIGTMRSARQNQIKRPFEFYYELFAQYLKDGKITLNPLQNSIKIGNGPYGKEKRAQTHELDEVNEILNQIVRDFPYYAEDVLSGIIGKIFVM